MCTRAARVFAFSDSKPIALMTTLVRAMLPAASYTAATAAGRNGDDGGFRAIGSLADQLESFASASSFSFQAGAAGVTISAAESAILVQVPAGGRVGGAVPHFLPHTSHPTFLSFIASVIACRWPSGRSGP